MARIEFPIATVDGELFQHEGVLYQYQGTPPAGFWAANTQNIVLDAFVDATGDVMSGDLTIANLAGVGSAGVAVDETGKLIRAEVSANLSSPFVDSAGDTMTGSLGFENTLGNITINLNQQLGSGTFTGNLSSGSFDVSDPTTDAGTRSGGGVDGGTLYAKRSDSNSLATFAGYNVLGSNTATIFGDGGADFASGDIELAATGAVTAKQFSASGAYLNASGIRQRIFNDSVDIGKVVLGDGTTAIGGALSAYPAGGVPNIVLSADGSITAGSVSCAGLGSTGEVIINRTAGSDSLVDGQLNGVTSLQLTADGNATFNDVAANDVTGQTSAFTSATAGSVTLDSSGIAIGSVATLDSSGGASFSSDVVISASLTADSLVVNGSITANSFGAVSGTTGSFTGQLNANNAVIQGDVTASDLSVSDISAADVTASGDLAVTGSGVFAGQQLSITSDGSITSHTTSSGIELGTVGSGPDTVMLKGFAGSTGAGTGTQRFSFTGDGAAIFASGNCEIKSGGDIQNVNNSYGAISDRKFKEDITPAKSQWSDIKAVQLVNYSFKPGLNLGSGRMLGVISQDLKRVCPTLVDVVKDYKQVEVPQFDDQGQPVLDEEGSQKVVMANQATGTKTESVKYSVLYLKAIGALQEAMQRIEKLEAEVKQLKD